MPDRRYGTGRLARRLIRKVGDIDVARTGPEKRDALLEQMRLKQRSSLEVAEDPRPHKVMERIAGLQGRLVVREESRVRRNALLESRIEQGGLWRAAGIEERVYSIDVSPPVRILIMGVLMLLDFSIFARAYAYVTRESDFSVIGGVIGLVVFVLSVMLAHQVKEWFLANAQQHLLRDGRDRLPMEIRDRLVTAVPNTVMLVGTAVMVLGLNAAGVWVRIEGSPGNEGPAIVTLQALIPVAVAVVEIFMHNPVARHEHWPNLVDHLLRFRLARAERKLALMRESLNKKLADIDSRYAVERGILEIEQWDLGITTLDAGPAGPPAEPNGQTRPPAARSAPRHGAP